MPAWCLNDQLIGAVGANIVEGYIGFDLVAVSNAKAYERLNAAYKAKTGKEAFDNSVHAVHVYDAIHLLTLAFQKAGTTKRLAVGKALIEVSNPPGQEVTSFKEGLPLLQQGKPVHYMGASGPIKFDQHGDMAPNVGIFNVERGKWFSRPWLPTSNRGIQDRHGTVASRIEVLCGEFRRVSDATRGAIGVTCSVRRLTDPCDRPHRGVVSRA